MHRKVAKAGNGIGMSRTYTRATLIWCFVGAMAPLTLASFVLTGLTVDLSSNPWVFLSVGVLLATSFFYRYRPNPHLCALTEAAAQLLLILLFGILLTYAAVAVKFSYVDAELYAIDNAIGFSRHGYIKFFAVRPWLMKTLEIAYFCMLPQFALVPAIMFFAKKFARVQRMMIAIAISLLATAFISVLTPSVTAFVHVDLPQLTNVPADIYTVVPTMEGLRDGTIRAVRLDHLEGLVSFPSFHTTAAMIFAWTLWTVKYVGLAGLVLNLALIAATPLIGAHYFIDLVGGAVVAFAAMALSQWLCRRAKVDGLLAISVPAADSDLTRSAQASI
jgi:membrane-associated phospholipid phosphatase